MHHSGRRALCADPREAGRLGCAHVAFIRGHLIVMGLGKNCLRDSLEVMVQIGMGMSPGLLGEGLEMTGPGHRRSTKGGKSFC